MKVVSREPLRKSYEVSGDGALRDVTVSTLLGITPDGGYRYEVYELHGVPREYATKERIEHCFNAWLAAGAAVEYEREALKKAVLEVAEKIKEGEM